MENFVSSVGKLLAPYDKGGDQKNMVEEVKLLLRELDEEYHLSDESADILNGIDLQQRPVFASERSFGKGMQQLGIGVKTIFRNSPVSVLYEQALRNEVGSAISSTGALMVSSGTKTGRSPTDKRIVKESSTEQDVWWGAVNIPLDERSFMINRERAIDYLNTRSQLYVVDGYAGHDPRYRIKCRIICSRAYHALFMQNMLVRPTREQLQKFNEPDYVIYNAGEFPANMYTQGMTSNTSVSLNFARREMVILGTQYAGEMKKGVFTIMNYLMPKAGLLPMHASCNEGPAGDTSIFFGLSGTGKTTLSADPQRKLIGDDEHVWTETGVFNIEGGCYAKCVNLREENEPEIFRAIQFGAVLENVVYDGPTREVDYDDISITENTRCAYPLEYIPNCKIPAVTTHPTNIIMLTCDAFGVLPPVSRLSPEQAMYHFISGYTAKVAGTEEGVTEPQATFSACFGAPFMVWHPSKYAELLAEKMKTHNTNAWLVNTGWVGGSAKDTKRIPLRYTRAIIDAIHDGQLAKQSFEKMPIFGMEVPLECPGVPSELLKPRSSWKDKDVYDATAKDLAKRFQKNFDQFRDQCSDSIVNAGPKLD